MDDLDIPLGEGGTTVDEPDDDVVAVPVLVVLAVLLNGSDADGFLRGVSGSLMAVTSLFASDLADRFAAVDDRGSPSPNPKFPPSMS